MIHYMRAQTSEIFESYEHLWAIGDQVICPECGR